MTNQHPGGNFAPPLTDEQIAQYEQIALGAGREIREAMLDCLKCVKAWWELPESVEAPAEPHPSGFGTIKPLDGSIQEALFELIPWQKDIAAIQSLFESISQEQVAMRNAAFHLLWHVKELDLNREPITTDRL